MAALPTKPTTSEPMQPATTATAPASAAASRPPRAERTTTSCGECRRRKQKCNQGQPCSNCARRFPQPAYVREEQAHHSDQRFPSLYRRRAQNEAACLLLIPSGSRFSINKNPPSFYHGSNNNFNSSSNNNNNNNNAPLTTQTRHPQI
ncbi:hypothetical protein B0J18DRAFT_122439 [Chaetomium sp. MPI-SDFR-AT-0129]|nr:hypothetical protein B0J18DRAFT_122439 [Chaetomium sp. MPI-SDFR-AT-0129]